MKDYFHVIILRLSFATACLVNAFPNGVLNPRRFKHLAISRRVLTPAKDISSRTGASDCANSVALRLLVASAAGRTLAKFGLPSFVPRRFAAAIAGRKGETDTLPQLIGDNTSLLRNRLDKLMTKFKKTNSVFYGGYRSARVIVDRGGSPKPAPTPTPPPTP